MSKSVKLLLVENVESVGIVGDVVNVRNGFARNYLLPRALATQPSEEKIKELAGRRAEAQKMIEAQRTQRVELNEKLKGVEITLTRSCNDQGILYGAVTQQDIAAALKEAGHTVSPRDIRITQTIKRIENFDVHVKLDSDLDQVIKVHVKADRELPKSDETEAPAPAEGAAPAGAGAGHADKREGRPRRDAWMLPDDSNRVVGWGSGKKDDAAADKGEKKAKSDKAEAKADKGEKKSKKKE